MGVSSVAQDEESSPELLDWRLAASVGSFLARGGPSVPRHEAEVAVRELRELPLSAERHVRELTGLGSGLELLPSEVVDRPGWVRAAVGGMRELTGRALPVGDRGPFNAVLGSGAGLQTGAVLAFLGTKVLGQYDPFGGPTREGQLLTVAPNIVTAHRSMRVSGRDFRMWVCLHECTHRLQFNAVDWLRDYFADEVSRLIGGVSDQEGFTDFLQRLPEMLGQLRQRRGDDSFGIVELVQSPAQREIFDRLIALSTLLEGHADYVMDAVGPEVVPSVATIRERFTARRKGGGLLDRVLRSLLGVDAKIAQYEKGARFTREVVDAVGMNGFNAVWTSPNTLPTRAEIDSPRDWLRRVHD